MRRWAAILAIVLFLCPFVTRAQRTVTFKGSGNASRAVKDIAAALTVWFDGRPNVERLKSVRKLLTELAGAEQSVARQLETAIAQAKDNEDVAKATTEAHSQLGKFQELLVKIREELGLADTSNVGVEAVAGLKCLTHDGIVFGYLGGCPGAVSSDVGGGAGSVKLLFAAGRVESENEKAQQTLTAIEREAKHLISFAQALDKPIASQEK